MAETILIREAEWDDRNDLVRLLCELVSGEPDFRPDASRLEFGIQRMLDAPETRTIFVAQELGRIVGMCAGQLLLSTAEGGCVLLVEDFIVEESFRGRGIGRRLMEAVEAWGTTRGAKRFQLLTDRNNKTALRFYRNLGWRRTQLTYLFRYPD
ncbi:MAG TPA: GNAT family N-acetyltransferase [bacterium]|nr:GNAT family N-acetyltransferase [bacterium]